MSENNHEETNEEVVVDDTVIDDIELEETEFEGVSQQDKIKKLRAELKAAKEQTQEYLTGWQKERASFANFKAEEEKKRKERIAVMKLDLVGDFFPVLDSFDMAFSNKEAWEKVDPAWRTGVEYIHTQFMSTLESYGVQKINAKGKDFDPLRHDPVSTVDTDNEAESDTVAQVIQSGYQVGDQILRPAKVKVYKYAGQ